MDTHPIRLAATDDPQRSRLTVFFRLLLAIPHFVWLYLGSIAAQIAVIVGRFAALFTGRIPDGLHRFIAAYGRYTTHLTADATLLADPFPGFVAAAGSYPSTSRSRSRSPRTGW